MANKNPDPAYPPPPPAGYSQPGQPGYGQPPAYGQTSTAVVVTQPTVAVVNTGFRFGENPTSLKCNFCNAQIVTSTSYQTGTLTWVAAGIVCLVGCWLGCCLIPFCINGTKDVVHSCPNCQNIVGTYRRMS